MRQFRLSSSERSEKGPAPGFKERLMSNWQLIFVLSMIMLIALILRVFFAYDVAVAGGYAFSGGSGAAYHAAVIESIMESWRHVIYDSSLNYPYSELNVNPPLMDWTYAIIAKIVTLFGVSSSTAVAGTLVWSTAILGTLTCIPVYYLAKEMFGHKAGIVSSLLYAICAVVISQTVLSNGTEAAFYGFFFVIMLIYLLRAVRAVSNESFERRKGESKSYFRSIFGENRAAIKNALIAGILMALVALSWNGFRPVFVMVCAIMIAQVVADRIRKKDPTSAAFTYATVLVIGTLISAPIYAAVGLWSAVYSGVFIIVILSIISALVISETKNKPWLLVIPILVAIIAIFMIVLWFALPDLFSSMVNGNSIYTDPTFSSLVSMNSSTSLSAMAAYYGWLTMWLPYLLICLMVYKLREQFTSPERSFIFLWLVAMVALGWSTSMNVYLVAPAYVIGAGAILAMLLDRADIPAYFASFKGSGFNVKQFLKNLFRPLPLGTILTVVLLVGAPNAMYAIDAASSSNSSDSSSGAFGYYVKNDSDWNLNDMWDSFSGEDKDGALLTYWDYSAEASLKGGFDSVAGTNGNGASAASNMLLSSGGAESNVALALRLIEYHGLDKFETYLKTDLGFTDEDYNKLEKILYDPESIKDTILNNPDAYGKYSSLSDENAMYIGAIMFLTGDPGVAYEGRIETLDRTGTGALTEIETIGLYEKACELSGKDISYIVVTRGMIPLMYGDGSSFSTLAYMNNFYLDANGSPTEFYTLNYNGYYNYTNAMYETLLWKTYFGPSPSELGHSSAVSMMNAFAASDGSAGTRPIPGFGLVNYEVAYWKVLYSENSEAEEGSDDWTEMDAYDAMAIQDAKIEAGEDPGLINFMSGLPVALKYVSCENAKMVSGTVTSSAAGTPAVEGVRVTLFDKNGVQRMTTFTDENGKYELCVPFDEGRIEITVGTTGSITGGLKVTEEKFDTSAPLTDTIDFEVDPVMFTGQIFYDDTEKDTLEGNLKFKIEGAAHGGSDTWESSDGKFEFDSSALVPDTYTLTVTDERGNTVCTATYNPVLNSGGPIKVNAYLSTGTLNITINDEYGSPISSDTVNGTQYVKLTSQDLSGGTPYSRIVELENGKATANVVPGTYTATLVDKNGNPDADREIFGKPVAVSSGSSATLTAKVQDFATIELKNKSSNSLSVNVTNGSYSANYFVASPMDTTIEVRVPVGVESVDYFISASYTDTNGDNKIWWDKYTVSSGDSLNEETGTFVNAYEFSRTVRSTSGTEVSSYMIFHPQSNDLPMVSVWSSDGEVYALLPEGSYVIHAYGSSSSLNEAYLERFTMPAGTSKGGYIDLEKAKTLTTSVLYTDSGSGKLPYIPLLIKETGKEIIIPAVTDGDGSYSKLVPYGNYQIAVKKNLSNGMIIEGTAQSGMVVKTPADATSTLTVTFRATSPTLYTGIFSVKDQNDVKLDEGTKVTFKLKATYSVENTFEVKADGTIEFEGYQLIVGEYTVTIDKKDGYYLSENVTLSINGGDVTMNAKKLDIITFTDLKEKDTVTVTALGDEKGWYGSDDYDEAGTQVYYFETGKQFSVVITGKDASDNKTVWYYYHNNTSNPAVSIIESEAVDLKKSFELKGYVGYAGTGIVEISDKNGDIVTILSVTSGKYSLDLPEMITGDQYTFEAFLGAYTDDTDPNNPVTKYEYTGSGVMDTQPESGVFNFIVLGEPNTDTDTKPLTVASSEITDKSNRKVTFKLTISGDEYRSLFLSGGSGWESIKFYSDAGLTNEISYANIPDVVAPGNVVVVYAEAVYKEDVALDSGLTVELKDAAGGSIMSHVLDITSVITPDRSLTVGKGENDNFGENDYLFSIILNNEGQIAEEFVLSYTAGVAPAGWYLVFVTSDGKTIYPNDGTAKFSVPGMSEVTVYVKLVNEDAEKLPTEFDIDLEVISAIVEDDIKVDEEFGKATKTGKVVTLTIVPGTTELDAGNGNASGPNIFMDEGSLPTYVWAMVVLSILLFIVILWQGMKRGVFSRRK